MLFSLFGKEKGDMDPTTTEILFQVIKRIPNVENERRKRHLFRATNSNNSYKNY